MNVAEMLYVIVMALILVACLMVLFACLKLYTEMFKEIAQKGRAKPKRMPWSEDP